MKTLKKLFSVSAIVALLGTLVPMYAFAAGNSLDGDPEFPEAYAYAHKYGITTQSTDNVDMGGKLTRIAMAKMIAKYAKNVLNLEETIDADKCNFVDVTAALDAQYDNGVTEACKYGLMGQNMPENKFRPNDLVTRAEFGTTLSRALNANSDDLAEMNSATPYYKEHLKFLNEKGIMKNISDPSMLEVRGYVMLMMMRGDDAYTPATAEGCTAEELLACTVADDMDACIAACSGNEEPGEPEEVKEGTLTVSMGDALADGTQIPGSGMVSFGTVKFKASSDSDVNLKSVTIEKKGLANLPAGTKVWFEQDGVRVSSRGTFNSDGSSVVSFAPAYTVKAGKTAEFDLYVSLATSSTYDIAFASSEFDTTAEKVNGGFTTPTLRTTDYKVIAVDLNNTSAGGKATAATNGYELGTFTVTNNGADNNTKAAIFKSITLRQEGSANLENLSDILLERDGEVVSSDYSVNGKYVTVKVSNDEIENGATANYILRAAVVTIEENDNYNFSIKNEEDVSIVEKTTDFRASNDTFNKAANAYTVEGGDVTFARDTELDLDNNVAPGTRVTLMKGTITTKESVTIEDITLTGTLTTAAATGDLTKWFSTLYLKVGSSTFTVTPTTAAAGKNTSPVAFGLKFEGTSVINGKANVELYGTLKSTVPQGDKLVFNAMDKGSFKELTYTSNEVAVDSVIGNIQGVTTTIEQTKLNVTRTDGLGSSANVAKGEDVTLYKINVASQQSKGARITSLKVDLVDTHSTLKNNVTLTLYVNGTATATRTYAGSGITFNGLSAEVNSSKNAEIELKANFAEAVSSTATFGVAATAAGLTFTDLSNSQSNNENLPAGAVLSIAEAAGTVTLDTDAVSSKLYVKGEKDVDLTAVKIDGTEGSVRLYDLELTANDTTNISNVRLTDLSGEVIATASSIANTGIKFTNLSSTDLVEKDDTLTYKVIADINDNVTAGNLQLSLTTGGATTLRTSNGETKTSVVTALATAKTHYISDKSLVVAQATAAGDLNTDAMRVTVTANGGNVTLTGLDLNLVTASYTGVEDVKVYRTSVLDANEVLFTDGTSAAVAATVSFNVTAGKIATGGSYSWDGTSNLDIVATATTPGASGNKAITVTGAAGKKLSELATTCSFDKDIVLKTGEVVTFTLAGGADSATIPAQNNVVTKGTTATFIVTYPNAVLKDTANNNNWTLSLRDVFVDGLGSVKGFSNVGAFPFTAKNN